MNSFIFKIIITFSLLVAIPSSTLWSQEPEGYSESKAEIKLLWEFQNQEAPPWTHDFRTDFSKAAIPFSQVLSGGPQKDGIPAINFPHFISIAEADIWMNPNEMVLVFKDEFAGGSQNATHIYPLQILMWHEIVNDQVGKIPVSITYCPLCNTGIGFRRDLEGELLDFGTTGRLRYSNLLMYDRQTESWWQQATGDGLIGQYAGRKLQMVPTLMLSWQQAITNFPNAEVLSRKTGFTRAYGKNPYAGYDELTEPFLYLGPAIDKENSPMTRVITVNAGNAQDAFPYPLLVKERVVQRKVGNTIIVVFWEPGAASPLNKNRVELGNDVGSANAFIPNAGNKALTFLYKDNRIIDHQTGSVWTSSGKAISGSLKGLQLEPVVSIQHFWFSWNAFREE